MIERTNDIQPVRFAIGKTVLGPDATYPNSWMRPTVYCVQFYNNPHPVAEALVGTLSERKTFAESLSTLYYAIGAEVPLVSVGGRWFIP